MVKINIGLTFDSIESMKMETVIRSPQKGIVAKLAHKSGVSLKRNPVGT